MSAIRKTTPADFPTGVKLKQKKGRYYIVYREIGGRDHHLGVYQGGPWSDQHKAIAKLAAIEETTRAQVSAPRGEPTFADIVDRYFVSPDFTELAPATKRSYRQLADVLTREEELGKYPMTALTVDHVRRLYLWVHDGIDVENPTRRGKPRRTWANHLLRFTRLVCNWYGRTFNHHFVNPCNYVKLEKVPPNNQYVTHELFRRVREFALDYNETIGNAMDLMLVTGVRPGQLPLLRFDGDITDEDHGRIQVVTRNKVRVKGKDTFSPKETSYGLVMTPELEEAIHRFRRWQINLQRESEFMVVTGKGHIRTYSEDGFRSVWDAMWEQGIADGELARSDKFSLHKIRKKSGSDHPTGVHLAHKPQGVLADHYRLRIDVYTPHVGLPR